MSTQKPDDNQDDEIWKSLFGGGAQEEKTQTKKGHTTLQFKDKKSKPSKHPGKKRKPSRGSSSRSRSHHSSQGNGSRHRNDANYSSQGPSTAERLSQFLCTPKHRARLPPPPLRCKFLKYPHKKDRFTKYCATNLELNYKWEMHHDSLFPLPLDLMDPDYYNPLKNPSDYDDDQMLNRMEDERILQLLDDREYDKTAKEETSMPEQEAFLLQTQYLTGGIEYELTESQRKGYDEDDRSRSRKNKSQKRRRGSSNRSSQSDEGYYRKYNPHSLKNVTSTFAEIQNVSHHPTRNVQVDRMFDVFPHEELLDVDYTHVQFHNNPSLHTKKCQLMSKYHDERMKMAELATQNALLRCVNKKGLEQERMKSLKQEIEDEDDDEDDETQKNEPDWFSLYATNGKRKASEYDDEDVIKFEWSAEFVPVQSNKKEMHFLVIPKDKGAHSDVYYANFKNRLSLRHRPTDSSQDMILGGKKGLSEQDKKFFKQQPMNIKLSVPHTNDTHEY